MLTHNKRLGFTLVEILIVVVILGILAAIVMPQFSNATTDTKKAALSDQLHNLRIQVQLYTLQHGDQSPNITGSSWDDLVAATTYQGNPRGPYLPSIPKNPLNSFSNVTVLESDPQWGDPVAGTDVGFVYNPRSGVVWGTNKAGTKVYNEADPNDPSNN
ncbi:MAG: type II secretion system protein [Tepidisphaeraceae bacterium]|jgi:general secretion pathway protein G